MKVLIIEDEYPAAERLQNYLKKAEPSMVIQAVLDSVDAAINYFKANAAPDLIFSDIQLSDGLSFEIFEELTVKCPVIFITAYDEYAIKAFKVNSIDYIIKPVKQKDLEATIQKFKFLRNEQYGSGNLLKMQSLLDGLEIQGRKHKKKFLVKTFEQLIRIDQNEIAYFITHHELVYLVKRDGKRFVVDYILDHLEKMLAPGIFFRVNRKLIVHIDSINAIHTYFNSRLKVQLQPPLSEDVIISREKAGAFKQWFEGEFVIGDE